MTLSGPREVTVTATFDLEQADPEGTVVTLSAAPAPGTDSVWTGCTALQGEPDTCVVTMDMNRTVSVASRPTPSPAPVP